MIRNRLLKNFRLPARALATTPAHGRPRELAAAVLLCTLSLCLPVQAQVWGWVDLHAHSATHKAFGATDAGASGIYTRRESSMDFRA